MGLGLKKGTNDSAPPRKYAALHEQLLEIHSGTSDGEITAQARAARAAYITGRWLEAVTGARTSMKRFQRSFRRANLIALGAAAVTPVIVTATAATTGTVRSALTIIAVCFGLLAAVGGVLLQTVRPGIRWRLHRKLRDDLEASAWELLATSSTSMAERQGEDPWAVFVREVERAIRDHNSTYTEEVAGVVDTAAAQTDSTRETV